MSNGASEAMSGCLGMVIVGVVIVSISRGCSCGDDADPAPTPAPQPPGTEQRPAPDPPESDPIVARIDEGIRNVDEIVETTERDLHRLQNGLESLFGNLAESKAEEARDEELIRQIYRSIADLVAKEEELQETLRWATRIRRRLEIEHIRVDSLPSEARRGEAVEDVETLLGEVFGDPSERRIQHAQGERPPAESLADEDAMQRAQERYEEWKASQRR